MSVVPEIDVDKMKKILKQLIPKPVRIQIRSFSYFLIDLPEMLLSRRDELTPPRRLNFVGQGRFKKIGKEFLWHFTGLGGLKPHESVLDVGCGIGRMAIPLTTFLNDEGRYEGFDIVHQGIDWCRENISPRYPNFHFQLADIYNGSYNPAGRFKASEYKFPYPDESFDFVFLTSVFTHLLPGDMKNYFSEVTRVLKKDGRCLITFFLLNEEALRLMNDGKSTLDFKYDCGNHRITDREAPEGAVSYKEEFVFQLYEERSLRIRQPVGYGSWCGRSDFLSYQDIIVASKG